MLSFFTKGVLLRSMLEFAVLRPSVDSDSDLLSILSFVLGGVEMSFKRSSVWNIYEKLLLSKTFKPENSFKPPPLNIQNLKYVPKKGNQQQTSFRVPNYQYGQHSPTALCWEVKLALMPQPQHWETIQPLLLPNPWPGVAIQIKSGVNRWTKFKW